MKKIIKIILIFLAISLVWQSSIVSSSQPASSKWEIKAEVLEINFTDNNSYIYFKFKVIESKPLSEYQQYLYIDGKIFNFTVKNKLIFYNNDYLYAGLSTNITYCIIDNYNKTKNLKIGERFYAKLIYAYYTSNKDIEEPMKDMYQLEFLEEQPKKEDNFYFYFLIPIIIILMILSVIISILIKDRKLKKRDNKNK